MTIWKWVIHEPTSRFVYSVRGGGDPEPRYDDYSFFGDQCWTEGGRLATGYIIVTIEADEKADRRTERYDTSSPTLCRPATQEEIDEFDRASDIARNRCMPIYQTRVVAFLDVLGWGDLVDKTVAHPEELERLKAALGFLSMPVLGMTQAREFFGEQEAHRIQPRRRDPFFPTRWSYQDQRHPLLAWSCSAKCSLSAAVCSTRLAITREALSSLERSTTTATSSSVLL